MPTRRRLKTASDARRFTANVIGRLDRGELDAAIASKLGYLVAILLKSIESANLENRIQKLEQRIGGKK